MEAFKNEIPCFEDMHVIPFSSVTFEGVEEGFRLLIDGKVPMLTSDYAEYNKNALEEFKKII